MKHSLFVLPDCSSSLDNLGIAVCARYKLLGRIEDLEKAITYHCEALALHPPGHPHYSSSFNNLANAVLTRYEQLGKKEDLDEVITCYRKSLTLHPPGHPDRSTSLNNLATAVCAQYQQSSRMEDLEEAIIYFCEALIFRPLGHPDRSSSLHNLANAVHTRYEKSSMVEDFEESFLLREQAVNDLTASPKYRLTAAIHWAWQAQYHHHNSVIRAYSMTLHLLDRCLIFYPNIDSQQRFLAIAHVPKSLASDAASAAIDADDLETAVELLEQGRTILWSKMKGYRYLLDPLRQINRHLADALKDISVQLEQLALSMESRLVDHNRPNSSLEVQIQRNCVLSAEREKIIGQI